MKPISALSFLLFLYSHSSLCQTTTGYTPIQIANELLEKAAHEEKFVGVVAGFSIDGEIKWKGSAGYSDGEHDTKADPAMLTRIASLTKPMTAVAILQLVEKGLINLDEPIQTYLPDFPDKIEGDISVKQLLNHTSGIPAYKSSKERENQKEYDSLAAVVNVFKDRALMNKPGKAFYYSTYGYVVLGLIIEKVSGQPFENYVRENIWQVLNMNNTGVEQFGEKYEGKSSIYHKSSNGKIKKVKPTNLSNRVPAGGFYSNVEDILKFGHGLLSGRLISEASFKLMQQAPNIPKEGNPYGLGIELYGQHPVYGAIAGHGGTQTGVSAQLMMFLEKEVVIAVLANTSGTYKEVVQLSLKLFDIAFQSK